MLVFVRTVVSSGGDVSPKFGSTTFQPVALCAGALTLHATLGNLVPINVAGICIFYIFCRANLFTVMSMGNYLRGLNPSRLAPKSI